MVPGAGMAGGDVTVQSKPVVAPFDAFQAVHDERASIRERIEQTRERIASVERELAAAQATFDGLVAHSDALDRHLEGREQPPSPAR